MNKFIVWIVVSVVAAGGVIYFITTSPVAPEGAESPAPSANMSVAPSPTPTPSTQPSGSVMPTPTGTAAPSATPTPGLIIEETKIYRIALEDLKFTPQTLTVRQGDVVIFDNQGSFIDKIEALNNVFKSPSLRPGDSWQLETANLIPATYEYRLDTHTATRGTLVVEE